MLFVSPSVRERGTDTLDTMPVEEDVMDAILRAKTLELGEVEEEEEPSQQTHGLTRRKSTAAFPNGGDHAAEVAEVGAGDQGTTAVETVKTSPPKQDGKQNPPDELPDRPMVTRTSQRDLKQTMENKDEKDSESEPSKVKGGRGGKGKGRGRGLKRPAAARNPKSRNQKGDGEDEESQEVENETGATATEATQHYSPPNSPLKPQDLEPAFSQVADAEPAAPAAKKPRKSRVSKQTEEDKEAKAKDTSKVSKRKKEPKEEDQQDAKKAKTTPKEKKKDDKPTKGSKTKKTADPEPDSSKSNGKANDDANKSKTPGVGLVRISGGPRVSFAGRICPKGEQTKHWFEVMVATYNTHVRPYVDCHSQVEVGWVQTIYPQ